MRSPLQSLEEVLGRRLREDERGSIATLNDLPAELVEEVRALNEKSRVASTEYLRFYVRKLDAVDEFISDVLELGTISASSWGIRDLICFSKLNANYWSRCDVPSMVGALMSVDGLRWWRVAPRLDEWDWLGISGAPGVLVRDATYWFEPPDKVDYYELESEELEEIPTETFEVSIRRWIASRAAWQLAQAKLKPGREASADEVARMLSAPVPVIEDAKIAVRALLREEYELGPSSDDVPGFRGPDDWYAR